MKWRILLALAGTLVPALVRAVADGKLTPSEVDVLLEKLLAAASLLLDSRPSE